MIHAYVDRVIQLCDTCKEKPEVKETTRYMFEYDTYGFGTCGHCGKVENIFQAE